MKNRFAVLKLLHANRETGGRTDRPREAARRSFANFNYELARNVHLSEKFTAHGSAQTACAYLKQLRL